ncbi:MAG: DUF4860 domain-containing protein [Clostridia bacterium]|nr:DUF4860 domain-containing protein [Clostridia bacterium]
MNERKHTVSGAFVFLLLGLFAVFSMVLVLFGARAYRNSLTLTDVHNEDRILHAIVVNTVAAGDREGAIAVKDESGIPTLQVRDEFDNEVYINYIYCYDGCLRELYTDLPFDPEMGEVLCAAECFEPTLENGMLTVTLKGSGEPLTATAVIRTEVG